MKKTLFGSMTLFALLGTLALGSAFKPRFADLRPLRDRLVNTLFAEHLKSFAALEGLLQVYLTSYRGVLQEGLLIEPRWLDELRESGDIEEAASGPGTSGAVLQGARGGLRFYIDGSGAFHLVHALGGGNSRADLTIGFGPIADELRALVRRPVGVAFFDMKNGTAARVYGRGAETAGKPREGKSPDGIDVRFTRVGRVRISKVFGFDGGGLVLVSEYRCIPSGGGLIPWGLFVLFVLAILMMGGAVASLRGGIRVGGWIMHDKAGASDVVDQIDREISEGYRAAPKPEVKKEDAAASIEEGLGEAGIGLGETPGEADETGGKGRKKSGADVLEKDGITIRKS